MAQDVPLWVSFKRTKVLGDNLHSDQELEIYALVYDYYKNASMKYFYSTPKWPIYGPLTIDVSSNSRKKIKPKNKINFVETRSAIEVALLVRNNLL